MQRPVVPALALALAVAAACGGSSGTTIAGDIDAILAASSEAMGNVDSVRFVIERTGDAVYIDENGTIEFRDAEGRFVSPSTADASVTLAVAGLATRVGAVAIDGETWLSNPITGAWEPAPAGYSFDPATLFDPETGWRPLLADGFTDAELVGTEDVSGVTAYRLRGVASGDRVTSITAGLVTADMVDADVWIDTGTGEVVQVMFDVALPEGTATWRLAFSDYGAEFEIEQPDIDG
ncbi:MAG TPA: LppX_LprAFG lipoprotein [Acidimicrobiia bacterium]